MGAPNPTSSDLIPPLSAIAAAAAAVAVAVAAAAAAVAVAVAAVAVAAAAAAVAVAAGVVAQIRLVSRALFRWPSSMRWLSQHCRVGRFVRVYCPRSRVAPPLCGNPSESNREERSYAAPERPQL